MLRVCGITYVNTTNYGTCFQAYALQKCINSMKIATDVSCEQQFVPLWQCNDHFSSKQNRFFYNIILRQFRNFQKKLSYTECSSVKDLKSLNDKFDAFICGSDVIWHPGFNHKLGLYYLDFANKYKFSYAASFGKADIQDSFLETAGNWISQLSDISVREQSSVEVVKRIANRTAEFVPDPVVLLKKEEWDHIANRSKKRKGYIFAYSTYSSPEYQQFLTKLSGTTGLKIVKSAWITSMKASLKQGILKVQSPEKWLQQLRDADYVVTNSFHATVFASIFHKKFFTVVHGNINEGSNIRMFDFLTSIGLSDRLLNEVPKEINLSDIDFSTSDKTINTLRDDGFRYLKTNLEAAYNQKILN